MIQNEKLLDKKTVMERYHFKKWTLEWLIRTRGIDGMIRVGKRKIFFEPTALDAWVQRNKLKYTQKGGKT